MKYLIEIYQPKLPNILDFLFSWLEVFKKALWIIYFCYSNSCSMYHLKPFITLISQECMHSNCISHRKVISESGCSMLLASTLICVLLSVIVCLLQTIAIASLFLACKAEETPRCLSDVAIVAYKLMYKWDPSASRRIKQRVWRTLQLLLKGILFPMWRGLIICISLSVGCLWEAEGNDLNWGEAFAVNRCLWPQYWTSVQATYCSSEEIGDLRQEDCRSSMEFCERLVSSLFFSYLLYLFILF